MFTKPNDETNLALARIARSTDWDLVEKWLQSSREASITASLNADDAKSRQAQGSLMAIDELLKNTRAAVELSPRR